MAYQALAAVLGGCQSLHTNSMDETLALPTEHAVTLALRTQQVLAYETGVTNTVDPLGGSYFVESLTRQMQQEARGYFERIEQHGRHDRGHRSRLLPPRNRRCRLRLSARGGRQRKLIVGVNAFQEPEETPIELLTIDDSVEREQLAALRRVKEQRGFDDCATVAGRGPSRGLRPPESHATAPRRRPRRATVGEVMNALVDVFGRYEGAAKW